MGQLGDALHQLRTEVKPDRIIIETSGSAFPATLAMEVNRLANEDNEMTGSKGQFVLDGVISVIDVENWQGYEDTSYTAKMQARYTDLIVFNKWELVDERRFDICLDRLGDLELDQPTPWVKSDRGRVDMDVLLGIDGALLAKMPLSNDSEHDHEHGHDNNHEHKHTHQSEVEVLSLTLSSSSSPSQDQESSENKATINLSKFLSLLKSSSKEEVYRIKGIIRCSSSQIPENSDPTFLTSSSSSSSSDSNTRSYILNWAFGRWTFTPTSSSSSSSSSTSMDVARLTFILARYESAKWKKKLEMGEYVALEGSMKDGQTLKVEKVA